MDIIDLIILGIFFLLVGVAKVALTAFTLAIVVGVIVLVRLGRGHKV